MADDIMTDEDSLISQDDIDKLLNASSFDEALSDLESGDDDDGEFSQDDIDSLLDGISGGSEPEVSSETPAADESGDDDFELVSQDDIDKLLSGASLGGDEAQEDNDGEFSQDDIDSLLDGISNEPSVKESSVPSGVEDAAQAEDADSDSDDDIVSQDDIDRLLGNLSPADTQEEGLDEGEDQDDEEDLEPISLGDISKVIENGSPEPEPVSQTRTEQAEPQTPLDEEILISDSEGMDIQDCLITQATIDKLIQEDEEPPPEVELAPEITGADSEGDPGPVPEAVDTVNLGDAIETDDWEAEGKDISQQDIDRLLSASDEDMDDDIEDYDSLISQDDIEELLKGSDEDDVDILAGEDDDILALEEEDVNQVVLEESDEEAFEEPEESGEPAVKSGPKPWYRRKLVLASITLMLILGAGIPSGYFFFFRAEPTPPVPEPTAAVDRVPEQGMDSVEVAVAPSVPDTSPGTFTMDKFLVLISGRKDGLNYVTADISIDYSNGKAFSLISDNISQYRDIVFSAIGTSLSSEKGEKLTESDLLVLIKDALNKALPEAYIDKVTFTLFKTG